MDRRVNPRHCKSIKAYDPMTAVWKDDRATVATESLEIAPNSPADSSLWIKSKRIGENKFDIMVWYKDGMTRLIVAARVPG